MTATDPIDLAEMVRRLLQSGAELDGVHLGVDVVDVQAMGRQLSGSSGPRFLATRFTATELADSGSRTDRLAARWAAKEAVAKAIGTGFRGLSPAMIEVVKAPDGHPSVKAVGDVAWPHEAQKWRWVVSLAHDGDIAIAAAMAVNVHTSDKLQIPSSPPRRLGGADAPNE